MYPVQSKVQLNPPITPTPYFNKKKKLINRSKHLPSL